MTLPLLWAGHGCRMAGSHLIGSAGVVPGVSLKVALVLLCAIHDAAERACWGLHLNGLLDQAMQ